MLYVGTNTHMSVTTCRETSLLLRMLRLPQFFSVELFDKYVLGKVRDFVATTRDVS